MKLSHKNYTGKLPATELLAILCAQGVKPSLPEGIELPAVALEVGL